MRYTDMSAKLATNSNERNLCDVCHENVEDCICLELEEYDNRQYEEYWYE